MSGSTEGQAGPSRDAELSIGLRHVDPFWHEYRTNVKQRWVGRSLLEVFVTEFRDRSSEYYQWAIHEGLCHVNGLPASPSYRLKMSDQVQNRIHRHEPGVTAERIRILYRNDELGRLVVVKPGSIPVHPTGRYYKSTLLEMLKAELGLPIIYTSNRLDRLTSGIMVCSTSKESAHTLSEQFAMGKVRKAYVCRVRGRFPSEEVLVDEPLLQCDRQSGISIIHTLGKPSETIFNLIQYDEQTDTSVVYCRPITGRTHQIRVHVLYLGHPIVNDPVYAHPIWDKYPAHTFKHKPLKTHRWKTDPGSSLSVGGSIELDEVVASVKMVKDDKDDWARWRDEMLFGELLREKGVAVETTPGPNGESAAEQRERAQADGNGNGADVDMSRYCKECRIPLLPDPKPEELFIYLHAIKYQTDDWTYEDEMPWWALSDWRTSTKVAKTADGKDVQYGLSEMAEMPPAFGLVGRGVQEEKISMTLDAMKPLVTIDEVGIGAEEGDSSEAKSLDSDDHPAVIFEVFGGMEDFAAADIDRQLRCSDTYLNAIIFERNTAHVVAPAGRTANAALSMFVDGKLNCVRGAYIAIATPAMPTELMTGLAEERRLMNEARWTMNHNKKQGSADEGGDEVPGVDGKRTKLEEQLLVAIQEAWQKCSQERSRALAAWKLRNGAYIDSQRHTFRATVDRKGYSLPTLTTAELERTLGDLVGEWLDDDDQEAATWEVDLTEPQLDVTLKLLSGGHGEDVDPFWASLKRNVAGRFVFAISVAQRRRAVHRPEIPNHLMQNGTPLARYRAYMLAVVLPLVSSTEAPLRIWEPCVGSGSIAVELSAALTRRNIAHEVYASDMLSSEVEKAKEMVELCGVTSHVRVARVNAAVVEQAEAFLGPDAVGHLDAIVTDLPWGRRVMSHSSISKLYPALLRGFVPVLKPGGTLVLMTAEVHTLTRAVKTYEGEARRRAWPWYLTVEPLSMAGVSRTDKDDVDAAVRATYARTVQCGYYVYVVVLRKRPLAVS